jgi:hypothetical protein
MPRRTQTYAIRLAVEGGGQVKAELVSVGQSGKQSLTRIEAAGGKASGGLKGLGYQTELLRTGIRTLGGAGVATAARSSGPHFGEHPRLDRCSADFDYEEYGFGRMTAACTISSGGG